MPLILGIVAVTVVVVIGALALIGVLVGSDTESAVPATYRIGRAPATAPTGSFVTTGASTADGVVVFGTIDDAEATDSQVWSADALTQGPGPDVQIGTIDVPIGVPYIYGVSTTADGFLGAGEVYFSESGDSQAAMFSSPDGVDWSLVAAPGGVGDASAVYDVAVAGDLALAVGVNDANDIGSNDVYQSTDTGVTWEPTRIDAATDSANLWGIGSSGEQFVLVGSTDLANGGVKPAIFVSDDGVTWRPAVLPPLFQGVLYDVAVVDGELVAVGTEYTEDGDDALVFASVDGANWRDVTSDDDATVGADEAMFSVIPSGSGAVVTGLIDDLYGFWEITVVEE